MKKFLTLLAAASILSSPFAFAQATHPSENYPGKTGGNSDQTNAAPKSPEQQNPSTGQQDTTSKPKKSQ